MAEDAIALLKKTVAFVNNGKKTTGQVVSVDLKTVMVNVGTVNVVESGKIVETVPDGMPFTAEVTFDSADAVRGLPPAGTTLPPMEVRLPSGRTCTLTRAIAKHMFTFNISDGKTTYQRERGQITVV